MLIHADFVMYDILYINIQKFGFGKIFYVSVRNWCLPRMYLFYQKYSKYRNIAKHYNFKLLFSIAIYF